MRLPRVPFPGFVRRRPFPWLLAAAVVTALLLGAYFDSIEYWGRPPFRQLLLYALQAVWLVLPLWVTAAWWRRIGARARRRALLVCGVWSLFALNRAAYLAGEVRALARNAPVVNEMLREPLRAMKTPPKVAAARALAAGDTFFLGTGGKCVEIPAVDTTAARRHGVRVISGTFHDGEPLTEWHREFRSDAYFYADDYNRAILERLGIELGGSDCFDPRDLRRADERLFWP